MIAVNGRHSPDIVGTTGIVSQRPYRSRLRVGARVKRGGVRDHSAYWQQCAVKNSYQVQSPIREHEFREQSGTKRDDHHSAFSGIQNSAYGVSKILKRSDNMPDFFNENFYLWNPKSAGLSSPEILPTSPPACSNCFLNPETFPISSFVPGGNFFSCIMPRDQ